LKTSRIRRFHRGSEFPRPFGSGIRSTCLPLEGGRRRSL